MLSACEAYSGTITHALKSFIEHLTRIELIFLGYKANVITVILKVHLRYVGFCVDYPLDRLYL